MKGLPLRKFLFLAVLLSLSAASAQWVLETIEKPVEATQLDGYVKMIADQQGVPNVRVEECDKTWKQILNSTVTDKEGHFHLQPTVQGATHYIRISSLGFNTRLYTVKLSTVLLF